MNELKRIPNIFCLPTYCFVHLLAIVMKNILEEHSALNMMHSFALLLRQAAYHTRLTVSIAAVMASEANGLDFIPLAAGTSPPPPVAAGSHHYRLPASASPSSTSAPCPGYFTSNSLVPFNSSSGIVKR